MDERKSSKCDHMKREWSKGVAASAMEKANEFDSDVIKENSEYIKKLSEADAAEYFILLENLRMAGGEEERADIRDRMREMRKDRYEKDTENKGYSDRQQEANREHRVKIMAIAAVTISATGGFIYKYRKPIVKAIEKIAIRS